MKNAKRYCSKNNIPYVFFGGRKWAELAHIQDIVSYLKISMNKQDKVAWQRILVLLPNLGDKSALAIIKDLEENNFELQTLNSVKNSKKKYFPYLIELKNVLASIMNEKGSLPSRIDELIRYYTPFLEKKKNPESRKVDLNYFRSKSTEFDSIEDFLTEMALTPPTEKSELKETPYPKNNERPLVISTIHSAKGLEWNTVFILRALDGDIPSSRSVDSEEQLEEERRLFYVAITRAKDNLFITAPQGIRRGFYGKFDSAFYINESRFLNEIDNLNKYVEIEYLKTRRTKFHH